MEGWVSIHRQIMDHWIYRESKPFSKREAWFDLILLANHCDTTFPLGNEIIEAKRGQVITSEVKLMERWKWSKTKLRSFLLLLENDSMIIKISDRKKTTISLVNYGNFQDSQTTEKPIKDREETANRLQKDTINNVNNVNNEIIKESTTTTTGEMNPFKTYESEKFGFITPAIGEELGALIDENSEEFVRRALIEASLAGIKTMRYVKGILRDWKALNHPAPWTLEKAAQQSNVKQFGKSRYSGQQKPQMPIADGGSVKKLSAEEREEVRRKARELDARNVR